MYLYLKFKKMVLKVYNSLTKKVEDFKPIESGKVSLYTCGPTVYDYAHIGNFRAYLFGDILKRTLIALGYEVNHIMNITDIDDKTIKNSQKNNQSLTNFTEFYTDKFFEDRDSLHIIPATDYTKATNYIKEMLEIVEILLNKGFAYVGEDQSIYFSINKDSNYGKLVELSKDKLKENAGGRIKKDEYEKDNPQDFALWKSWDEEDGDVVWDPKDYLGPDTKIQKGRPGWHIECSAMSMSTLGETIDIHTGGMDNMFHSSRKRNSSIRMCDR
jgi:cysteinyl-tRNA synthetase